MRKKNDVGVIVGRFQVDVLHEAHKDLFEQVIAENAKVIVALGLAPTKVTKNNPLDFEARKQMILEMYPDVNVVYITDERSDEKWSKKLDKLIADLSGPGFTVMLYGGRDGFMKHYSGRFPCTEIEQKVYISGSEIRHSISKQVKSSREFRMGVIWAAQNQFNNPIFTVDIAPMDNGRVLLARKPDEPLLRFIGGFTDSASSSLEQDALREAEEETGGCRFGDMEYITSIRINDWRYQGESVKINTAFFQTDLISGVPVPSDDLEGGTLEWVHLDDLNENLDELVMPEHRPLAQALLDKTRKLVRG